MIESLPLKLGLVLESLGLPLQAAFAEAAKLSAQGVQIDAVGPLAPENLGATARRDFRTRLRSFNLELAALACPLRKGLDAYEFQERRIEHVAAALQLAYDLGAKSLVVPVPKLPAETESAEGEAEGPKPHLFFSGPPPRGNTLRETLVAIAAHGDRIGTTLLLDGGLDSGTALAAYLDSFDSGSLAAIYDPANYLVNGFDPLASLQALGRRVKLVHARDARRTSAQAGPVEVPVGEGDFDWLTLIAMLEAHEYRGFLCIERTGGENRIRDTESSMAFLRRFVPLTRT